MKFFVFVAIAVALTVSGRADAQDATSVCGAPPVFDRTVQADGHTQADIKGKAQALSRLFGSADLGGQIENDKKTIFESASSAEAARAFAYYQNVVCVLIFKDVSMDTLAKLKAWGDAQKAFQSPVSQKQGYDWRKDAQRLSAIYSGEAYSDKHPNNNNTFIRPVGNYVYKPDDEAYFNTISVTEDSIAVHLVVFRHGSPFDDVIQEAKLSELNEKASYWTGNYDDGTPKELLQLECASGECVRWTGDKWGSSGPGEAHKEHYAGQKIMRYIPIPLANSMDDDLRNEMKRIFARLISSDHSESTLR